MSFDKSNKYFIYAIGALCAVIIKLFAWGNAKDLEIKKSNEAIIILYREFMKLEVAKAKQETLKKIDSL